MNNEAHTTNPGIPLIAKLALITACLFWAASFIATKVALAIVPPLTVVMVRLAISALCFLAWFLIRRKGISIESPRDWGRLVLLSLFGTGLHYSIQTIGLGYTTASNGSLYAVTGPITITIIAFIFLGEKITFKKLAGIILAIIGVLVVMGIDTIIAFDLKGHLLGDLLVLASIFMWGVFTVMGKGMTKKLSALDLTGIVTFMGAIYMLPLGLWEMNRTGFSISQITLNAWAAIAFLGVTCSFMATLLYFFALERSESQKVGVYLYTIPPMTYVIAGLVLGERVGLNLLIGSVVVLAGVALTERG
jgi:drug/metabolite transporter (DMT)-like permease